MPSDDQNIIELLGPREVIGQAIEVLMATCDVNRDAAFEMLVQDSSGSHRKVRETAAAIVAHAEEPAELPAAASP